PAEKTTFFVFFPALLFANTAKADFASIDDLAPMVAAAIIGVLGISAIAVGLRPRLKIDGPAFTSVFQGTIRPNVYLGIAACVALYGEAGLTLVSVCVAVLVPLVNVVSVVVLVRHASSDGEVPHWGQTLGPIARNPLILACAGGALLNVSGYGLPPVIGPFLEILGRAALPIGLLAVGAGLNLSAMRGVGRLVSLTTVIKLIALPTLTWAACLALGVDGLAMSVCVLYAALPNSATSYVLARQMGGDTELLASIITATTLFAMLTMPAAVLLLP
ncbi:MAG: AEC family transporter, partial [Rhodospirillaceae bacterium]|nr:AEC family transporter [Rhodospirillaceae bacterium]